MLARDGGKQRAWGHSLLYMRWSVGRRRRDFSFADTWSGTSSWWVYWRDAVQQLLLVKTDTSRSEQADATNDWLTID